MDDQPSLSISDSSTMGPAKLKPQDVLFFNRQLASMARLNMPLAKGVRILASEVRDPNFKNVLTIVQRDLEEGIPLSKSLAKFPESFSRLYLEVLKSGEASDNLAGILEELSSYSQSMAKIKRNIASALYYPAFITVGMFGFVLFFLGYLTPIIKKMVDEQRNASPENAAKIDAALPKITKVVFFLSDYASNPFIVSSFVVIIVAALVYVGVRLRKMGDTYDDFLFKLPLFGPLFQRATLMKLTRTMRELLNNGVSMVNTLRLSTNVVGDNRFKTKLQEITSAVEEGRKFSRNLANGDVFPDTMVWKLQMAEEKGIVEEALKELAQEFEADVDDQTDFVTEVMSPAIMVGMFGVLLLLVLALFIPLTKMHELFR